MSALDEMDLFGSGPHDFRPGPWRRAVQHRAFAGLDGELALDMGMRSRAIVQAGRLQADTASDLRDLIEAIEAFVDGRPHALTDNHGFVYTGVILESFEPKSPLRRGRGFFCEYEAHYLQSA